MLILKRLFCFNSAYWSNRCNTFFKLRTVYSLQWMNCETLLHYAHWKGRQPQLFRSLTMNWHSAKWL